MEFMSVSSTLYDTDRFGAALPRFTPRQSDLLMVVGTVSHKQVPVLKKVYEQMCEPKWVIAFGVCATSGGFYQNYAALPGIDKIIPVDVYIPGCPPRPEMVIDGDHEAAGHASRASGTRSSTRNSEWVRRKHCSQCPVGLAAATLETGVAHGVLWFLIARRPVPPSCTR